MSLATPVSVQKLQTALHAKAKEASGYRFYALYDKVYRQDVLAFAYQCCRANGGAAGVDSQTFENIEAYGLERWLDELAQELKSRTYRPLSVRRVYIPKPDGKRRPLGVPAIRDRVAQTAAVLVLEPIFEADLQPEQYAYRRDRSALDAVRQVHKLINTGYGEVVDADLSSYFDSLPHAELLKSVARRVVDGAMLHLIKMWLEAAVEETDERGHKYRSTRNRDEGRGSPQGSPLSPLVSNRAVYLAIGVRCSGHKEILGLWIEQTEGAKFWLRVMSELRNRGVRDLLIAVVDGLKGFPEAITSVFPKTVVQTCIVHLIRYSMHFAWWKERPLISAALKPIYQAESAAMARERLEDFDRGPWGHKYPAIAQSWRRNWEQVIAFFAFAPELRKILYTTNAIESLNAQVRKAVRVRGHFPSEGAAAKLIWLVLRNVQARWKNPPITWQAAKTQMAIQFEDRFILAE
jgi:hypothetical protein